MSLSTAALPDDLDALRAFALACQGELKAAETAVQFKTLEIEKLKFQIAKLRRMQFGRSSERINRQIEQRSRGCRRQRGRQCAGRTTTARARQIQAQAQAVA